MLTKFFRSHQLQKLNKGFFKGAHISKSPPSPPPQKIPFIDEMLVFMHKYIERIINVDDNSNCGYRAVLVLLSKGEDNHTLV